MPKGPEIQDKRGEGQPPQDYPESLEPGKQQHLHANKTYTCDTVFQLLLMYCLQWLVFLNLDPNFTHFIV